MLFGGTEPVGNNIV